MAGRVRAALDEAKEKAREIVANAEEKAKHLISDAEAEADKIREGAESEAHDRLAKLREALSSLEGNISGAPSSEIDPGPAEVPSRCRPSSRSRRRRQSRSPSRRPSPSRRHPILRSSRPRPPSQTAKPRADQRLSSERSDDPTAARIVAMKMALDGSPRDEIEVHLDANY